MRVRVSGLLLALALLPAAAAAQSGPSRPARPAVDVTKAMLDAAAEIGAAALKPGVGVSDRNIATTDTGGYNVSIAYVTRPATTEMSGSVLAHDKITEIYYVVSGRGTHVTGQLTDGTQLTSSTTIGPSWSSKVPIKNGRKTVLGPGEMQIIPPGTGHVWAEIADGGIVYMVIRIDPDHLLAQSK